MVHHVLVTSKTKRLTFEDKKSEDYLSGFHVNQVDRYQNAASQGHIGLKYRCN